MTETHTPLPWVANDQHSGANPWRIESDDGVYANDGWIIAECLGPDAEANAAFIVHAVNSHHDLIEALREATQIADYLWRKHYRDDAPDWRPLPDLRGVISQIDNMVTGLTKEAGRG